jgi:pyridoxine 5-phosphate synthase
MRPAAIRLGFNIDHVATLRNARGGTHPDPLQAAQTAIAAGADGITLHLREDRRHIRDDDVRRVHAAITVPLNLEMAATEEMVRFACALRPHACCLVPERRAEITTEGGLDAAGLQASLAPSVAALLSAGIRVSLFVDPDPAQLHAAVALGAPVVELHTGAYAEGGASELQRLQDAAMLTQSLGLECHAGHGLTLEHVRPIAAIPQIQELNIGHYIVAQALFDGLPAVIRRMKRAMQEAR